MDTSGLRKKQESKGVKVKEQESIAYGRTLIHRVLPKAILQMILLLLHLELCNMTKKSH